MKKLFAVALAAGAAVVAVSPAAARDGCGRGYHRGPHGHCRRNVVYVAQVRPVIGVYYGGRGYWDGRRYWWHRERWHGGWRYR